MRDNDYETQISWTAWITAVLAIFLLFWVLLRTYEHFWTVILKLDITYLAFLFLVITLIAIIKGVRTESGFVRLSCYLLAFSLIVSAFQILIPILFENFIAQAPF